MIRQSQADKTVFALQRSPQICPEVEPEPAGDTVSAVLDTSLTPAALKKLSRSVMDLSGPSLSDVTDISKSTARGPIQKKIFDRVLARKMA